MHASLTEIVALLDTITEVMSSQNVTTTRFSQSTAWHVAAVSPLQLAMIPREIARYINAANLDELTHLQQNIIDEIKLVLQGISADLVPNIYGNPLVGVPAYFDNFSFINTMMISVVGWVPLNSAAQPVALARRLSRVDRDLQALMPDELDIKNKISQIVEAAAAADELPTTLQDLKATQRELKQISSSSSEIIGKLREDSKNSALALDRSIAAADEAEISAKNASESHRITTTVGLAAAFSERERSLNASVYVWVGGLIASLVLVGVIGYFRIQAFKEALSLNLPSDGRIWIQLLISVFSVGAPIWFAWISTKQIGQRFRLSEDYAFKASVAKAYEGYRREAVRIDTEFEKALFASVLSRLDEPPLRLVETQTHGSPLHEFTSSKFAEGIGGALRGLTSKLNGGTQKGTEEE